MKNKVVLVLGILVMLFSLTGCFGGNPYAKHKDDKWYAPEFAFYVANELLGDKFNSERKDVDKELKNYKSKDIKELRKNRDGSMSLTKSSKGSPWENYYTEGYYYVGELDDNRPDGIGALYKKEYNRKGLILMYSGEWEDGMYNGYGQLFENPSSYKISILKFEGNFEENKPNGKGIRYIMRGDDNNLTSCEITYGEFYENFNRPVGEVKIFTDFVLRIEGKFDEDGDGKGIEYYGNGNVKYKGEFERYRYHGDGVFYDENGKEVYDGEWENGDYK